MYKNFLNDTFKYRVYPIPYIGGVPDVLEEAMVTDLVKNNIKGQYKEFKQCLTSERGSTACAVDEKSMTILLFLVSFIIFLLW